MICFFTSTLGDFYLMDRMKVGLTDKNEFIENLRKVWTNGACGLFISADPDAYEENDRMRDEFFRAFGDAGLDFSVLRVCDSRCEELSDIERLDVIILGGGHVPTENRFFKKIGLAEKLGDFDGVLLSLSAGSMNCAKTVYSLPELDGEAVDPEYQRWLSGLGLTECMMIPHYQYFKDVYLDGLHVISEIAMPDSFGKRFYALPDGSYVLSCDGRERIFGEAYLIRDGVMNKICSDGEYIEL